jgi:hypothetical protein
MAMRIALALLLAVLASGAAHAQAPQVARIDVIEYGIYTGTPQGARSEPGTAAGTVTTLSDIEHAATTRKIPAQQGVRFGFRFIVAGNPAGAVVPLHMVTIFPPPGLTNPATQIRKDRSEYESNAIIGTASFKGYNFTNDWEVAPGIWTMQIWYQGRKLAEQKFTVVRP